MEIQFLTVEHVLEIHKNQIDLYGGSGVIRDYSLLESAILQPQSSFDGTFLHNTLFDMAAAYLYHIVNNHPFIDGNKRVGIVSAYIFLIINGFKFQCGNEELENFVLEVAKNKYHKKEISRFLKNKSIELRI